MSDLFKLQNDPALLLSDPIFQLNMVIWSVKDLPKNSDSQMTPFLKEAGYYIFALNRKILLTGIANKISLRDYTSNLAHPVSDVWLRHESDDDFDLILELKSRGFGEESSTVKQINKMLAGSYDLSTSIASKNKKPGFFILMTLYKDADKTMNTLNSLKAKLEKAQILCAPVSVIGLDNNQNDLLWKSPNFSTLPKPLRKSLSQPVTIFRSMGNIEDMIQMYFIPWLPGVDKEASPLISDGLAELTGRVLSYVQQQIKGVEPPDILSLRADSILKEATYGVFSYWKDKDKNSFAKKVIYIILNHVCSTKISHKSDKEVDIEIKTETIREDILKDLEGIEVNNRAKNLEGVSRQQHLF